MVGKPNQVWRGLLLSLILLCFLVNVTALPPALGPNDVYIQNYDTQAKTNDPVYVPISFVKGQYSVAALATIQLKNTSESLPTQVVPTSYFNDGTVRTAMAKVLWSSPPATSQSIPAAEKIYQLSTYTGSPPPFQMDPNVNNLLHNTNGFSLTVQTKDLLGGTYSTVLDIDGYGNACQYAGTEFPANCVKQIENGPVTQVWEIHKDTTPQAGAGLNSLFTNVFFVTAISGKDYVLVDHFLIDHVNLDEQPKPTLSGSTVTYTKPAPGTIFYDNAQMIVSTGNTDHSVYLLDAQYLAPSVLNPTSTSVPVTTVYDIMPTNGAVQLQSACGDPADCTVKEVPPSISGPNNYIAAGQGFTSHLVIGFSPVSKHPIDESNVYSGQSLARWSLTEKEFFQTMPDPEKLSPGFDFDNPSNPPSAKNNPSNFLSNYVNGFNVDAHRFGTYDYPYKDFGATGYTNVYDQDPDAATFYLLSCYNRCKRSYIDALRFHAYGAGYATNHFPGYRVTEHPKNNLNFYKQPAIESWSWDTSKNPSSVYTCTESDTGTDFLGLCQNLSGAANYQQPAYPGANYRTDAQGRTMFDYETAATKNRIQAHYWTMREPAHLSLGMEWYRWLFTGDYLTRMVGLDQMETITSMVEYDIHTHSTAVVGRARGRMLKNAVEKALITGDPREKNLLTDMVQEIDNKRNKMNDGGNGTNTYTGDYYPTKYLTSPTYYVQGSSTKVQPFEDAQIRHGLGLMVDDYLTISDPLIAQIKAIMADGMHFWYTYVYKSPFRVRNGTPSLNGQVQNIHEGDGANSQFGIVVLTQTTPDTSTQYILDDQPQLQPGWCAEMVAAGKIRQADPTFLMSGQQDLYSTYFAEYQQNWDREWVRGKYDNYAYKNVYGIRVLTMSDDKTCGMTYYAGVPNAAGGGFVNGFYSPSVSKSCPDADHDGFSTCDGDCADTDASVNPGVTETSCTDSKDNNCNGLSDCNDPACGDPNYNNQANSKYTTFCAGAAYCGNLTLNGNEQCDVRPFTANAGVNTCGPIPGIGLPLNPAYAATAVGFCVPAFVPNVPGCTCAAGVSSFFVTGINPSSITQGDTITPLVVSGVGFQNGDQIVIGGITKSATFSGTGPTLTFTLTAGDYSTLGTGVKSVQAKQVSTGTLSNGVNLTINASGGNPTLGSISPNTAVINTASGTLTLAGTNFVSGDQAEFTGASAQVVTVPTTFVSSASLTTSLSAAQTVTLGVGAGTVRIKRGTSTFSNTVPFTITSTPTPTLNSIVPNSATQGSASGLLTLSGTNFASGDQAEFTRGTNVVAKSTTFGSSSSLTTSLTGTDTSTLGVGAGTVRIKRGTSTFSNSVAFTINSAGPVCGNNIVEAGEVCDPPGSTQACVTSGGYAGTQSCNLTCTAWNTCTSTQSCGDGVCNGNETTSTCPGDCPATGAVCGNGVTENGEQCDDGNTQNNDGCSSVCHTEYCGDGRVQAPLGETCDDGNQNPCDACTNSCQTYAAQCGNTCLDSGEQCDISNFGSYGNGMNQCSAYSSQFVSGDLACVNCSISTSACTSGSTGSNGSNNGNNGGSGGGGSGGGGNGSGSGGGSGGSGSGSGTGGDDSSVGPPACQPSLELCDGLDNDCDGQTDEGCTAYDPPTCFNGKHDPNELRKDCGGVCSALCYTQTPTSLYTFTSALASPFLALIGIIARILGLGPN